MPPTLPSTGIGPTLAHLTLALSPTTTTLLGEGSAPIHRLWHSSLLQKRQQLPEGRKKEGRRDRSQADLTEHSLWAVHRVESFMYMIVFSSHSGPEMEVFWPPVLGKEGDTG